MMKNRGKKMEERGKKSIEELRQTKEEEERRGWEVLEEGGGNWMEE